MDHSLRIFVSENARHEHLFTYEWLVRRAADHKLAGATATRSLISYGGTSLGGSIPGLPRLSTDFTVVVEIVDTREKLDAFLQEIEQVGAVGKGLAVLQAVEVSFYKAST